MHEQKIIRFNRRAIKEIDRFPHTVVRKIDAAIRILLKEGHLKEPLGKKITPDLFEIRIKFKGQWRVIYAYQRIEIIYILLAFHKKTQSTPKNIINTAIKRMQEVSI